jgi:hypothetical protein
LPDLSRNPETLGLGLARDPRARIRSKNHYEIWAEVQDLYRKASPEAAKEIIRLETECEDERVRSVCAGMVLERAWGKPKEYDPNAEGPPQKPKFDPSLYTFEDSRFFTTR